MNSLLYVRVHRHHSGPEIGKVPHQDLRVPRGRHEEGSRAGLQRCQEDIGHLKADEKGKGHDDRSEAATVVVSRFGEFEVEVSQQGTNVSYECGPHRQYWVNEAVVDQRVDAPILHHSVHDPVSRLPSYV